MWESPINQILGEMQITYENECMKVVQSYGLDVNKEELTKALQYDRNQYDKGYKAGYENAIDECYMKAKTMMEELSYKYRGRRNGKTHRVYCIQALEFLRQVAKEMKGE